MVDYSVCNDEELIREYRSTQNQQIMAILFTRYADIGFRTAMRFVRNQADAEDILQTTYIHFLQNLDLFREGITIRPWLMKMIVNTCKNKLIEEKRRQKRKEKVASERFVQQVPETQNSELESEKAELKELLRKNVDLLPEKYRSPIWLVLFEEVSYSEVATVLELPEKTIRTQVSRGLEKLRQALSSYGSLLSIATISELIKETTLEKAPSSINHLISSPEIYQLALNSAKQNSLTTVQNSFYSLKVAIIVGIATVIAIISFLYVRNTNISETQTTKTMNLAKDTKEKNPMHLALDFNQETDIAPYEFLGTYNYLVKGGIKDSGCIEVSKTKLILRFSIDNITFPLKLTYLSNTKIFKGKKVSGTLMSWSSWSKMSMIYDVSKPKLVPFSNGESYPFENDEDWEDNTIWITKNSIDIWCFGKRMNLYIIKHNENDKFMYLYLLNHTKIDDLKIETVDENLIPDISNFIKINEEVLKGPYQEISSIKKYLSIYDKNDLDPKLQQFKSFNEIELLDAMKYMVQQN